MTYLQRGFSGIFLPAMYVVAVILLPSLHIGGFFHSHQGDNPHGILKYCSTGIHIQAEGDCEHENNGEKCQICQFISDFTQIAPCSLQFLDSSAIILQKIKILRELILCKVKVSSNPSTAPPFSLHS